jgi:hypothetical protein
MLLIYLLSTLLLLLSFTDVSDAARAHGYWDSADSTIARGWACNANYDVNPQIHFYFGGPSGSGAPGVSFGATHSNRGDVFDKIGSCRCPSSTSCPRGFAFRYLSTIFVSIFKFYILMCRSMVLFF